MILLQTRDLETSVSSEPRDHFAWQDAVVVARASASVVATDVAVACVAAADALAVAVAVTIWREELRVRCTELLIPPLRGLSVPHQSAHFYTHLIPHEAPGQT